LSKNVKLSPATYFNMDTELKQQNAIREVVAGKLINSAH
jgi:phosphoribosylformylglycinamidine synthase subunit PurL